MSCIDTSVRPAPPPSFNPFAAKAAAYSPQPRAVSHSVVFLSPSMTLSPSAHSATPAVSSSRPAVSSFVFASLFAFSFLGLPRLAAPSGRSGFAASNAFAAAFLALCVNGGLNS